MKFYILHEAHSLCDYNDQEVVRLFADLIKSGMAWSLQGHYGRTATTLINEGWIDREGNVSLAVADSTMIFFI